MIATLSETLPPQQYTVIKGVKLDANADQDIKTNLNILSFPNKAIANALTVTTTVTSFVKKYEFSFNEKSLVNEDVQHKICESAVDIVAANKLANIIPTKNPGKIFLDKTGRAISESKLEVSVNITLAAKPTTIVKTKKDKYQQ